MNGTKKIVSLLIALTMLMSVMSIGAFAAGEDTPASLLPLEEKSVRLDLTGYLPVELENIPVRTILSKLIDETTDEPIAVQDGATTVWSRFKTEDSDYSASSDVWKKVGIDETIDMSRVWWYDFEIIVGSGLQLDPGNIRYSVDAEVNGDLVPYEFTLYTQSEDGTRLPVQIDQEEDVDYQNYLYSYSGGNENKRIPGYDIEVPTNYDYRQEYYLSIKIKPEFGKNITVYSGTYASLEEIQNAVAQNPYVDLTYAMTSDMSQPEAGWKETFNSFKNEDGSRHDYPAVTVVYTNADGSYVGLENAVIRVYPRSDSLSTPDLHYIHEDGEIDSSFYEDIDWDHNENDDESVIYTLEPGYDETGIYHLSLNFHDGDLKETTSANVDKAVVGLYDSLEGAAAAEDIKDKLFEDRYGDVANSFEGVFAGSGISFTIFAKNKVHKITIRTKNHAQAKEKEYIPDFSSSDRDLRLSDAKVNDEELDGYVLPFEHDSYGINGFQTLFVDDADVDLTSVSPVVNLDEKVRVYTNGILEETGEETFNVTLSPQNFTGAATADTPANTVKYTVSAENRSDQKNYWLNIVKKAQGAKLYVNGPDTREVFLDDAYGNKHDIFIANIGDQPLTGISVSLNATNVVLDDYWTVGGDGNNTLAPTDFSEGRSYTNEHQNIAKIRIIPTGEGKIDGTLTVAADGQEPRVITLKGQAGNPKIDTESIPFGVKYVPYSSIITTTNIHDWNKVTFSMVSGSLPAGVELLPSGEIYGVPTETGDFSFRVMADYSYSRFSSSYADFTLHIDENTDENVEAQTDEGYSIMTRVQDMTTYTDQVFEIEGALVEFMDFWLDGQKLARDVDYGAEEGSTKITIKAQTFRNAGTGTHTIAGEFRKEGDRNKTMAKAAQNYTSGKRTIDKGNTTNSGSGNGNSGSTGTNHNVVPIVGAYTVGTQVVFNGGQVFVSSDARRAAARRGPSICIITYLAPGTIHPYHLVSVDDGRVYGWVNAEDVEENTNAE